MGEKDGGQEEPPEEERTEERTLEGTQEEEPFPRGPLIKTALPLTRAERGLLLLIIGAPIAIVLDITGGSPTAIFVASQRTARRNK